MRRYSDLSRLRMIYAARRMQPIWIRLHPVFVPAAGAR
jgi:hypothetical protein